MLMSRDGLSPLEPCTQLLGLGTRGTGSTRQGWWQGSSICSTGLRPLQESLQPKDMAWKLSGASSTGAGVCSLLTDMLQA